MGLFGGMSEDELRVSGTPGTARVVYADDTGKRRDDGARAKVKLQLKIDGGSARGRELDQAKWVPADRIPRVGEIVHIRYDPDDVDDWAWGDAAMYGTAHAPAATVQPPPGQVLQAQLLPGVPPEMLQLAQNAMNAWGSSSGFDANQLNGMIQAAFQQGNVTVQHVEVGGATPAPAPADETAARLRQVDEMHQQGLLDADEHKRLRQRIIDSI